jgi:eukaryotic-like serine/threonine-protein kinase
MLGQKKYAEAEPLLLQAYEELRVRETKSLPTPKQRVAEASARIVEHYDAWGKKDQADKWRNRLASVADDKPNG